MAFLKSLSAFLFKRPFFPDTTAGRFFGSFLMGCVGGIAMGPLYLWPALLLAMSFFWIMLSDMGSQAKWKSFVAGWLFGLGYFVFSLYWVGNALLVDGNPYKWAYPLALVGLPTLLALFTGSAALVARILRGGRDFVAVLVFMISMMLFEYLRGHLFTGFPWNLYGMCWTGNLAILQFLSVGGVYGLTFLTVFLFTVPGYALKGTSPLSVRLGMVALAVAVAISLYGFGVQRLLNNPTQYNENVVIDVIQPDIPQAEKWDGDKVWDNYRKMISLIRVDPQLKPKGQDGARVMVLPETAITYHHLQTPQAMDALRGATMHYRAQTYILTGALLRDSKGYSNSLIALDRQGNKLYRFDKFHLVPFGEYIPLQKYIPFGPVASFTGMVSGPGPQTAMVGNIPPFSPLVCYEIIFPGFVTTSNPERPEWIVNVTNDAWYGISAGPYQHLAQAIYRAIEEGIPVVRSANTGVSAVIDPYGRLLTITPLMSSDRIESYLPLPAKERPLFSELKNL